MSSDASPPTKRAKSMSNNGDEEDVALSCLNHETLFQPENSRRYLKQFQEDNHKPYPHNVLSDFCQRDFLMNVLEEIKQNTKVNFKESDLFKFYQSIDLANLNEDDDNAKLMPNLVLLKKALYSEKFRKFMETITGLPPNTLTEQVDCAANCHTQGCHLLCHDDVIGTRKVSYIIYLTDPNDNWSNAQGGRLELYDNYDEKVCSEKSKTFTRKAPTSYPCKTILPTFNSLAYFVVLPGESFHSVQEVFGDASVRLSIQGWYHAKDVPENMKNATLKRLKSIGRGEDTEAAFSAFALDNDSNHGQLELSKADYDYLARFINTTYLKPQSLSDIKVRFEEDSSIQLRHFLNAEWSNNIQTRALQRDDIDGVGKSAPVLNYSIGESDSWKPVGPSHKQRFLEYINQERIQSETNETNDPGRSLHKLRRDLFESSVFARYISKLTSLDIATGHRGHIRRFRPGLDYSVAHYGILTTSHVLDATLCFAAGKGNQCVYDEVYGDLVGNDDDAVWESGDVGGFECYIAADDDDDEDNQPHDEYVADDDTELLSVSASNNTLSLVYRDPGTMRFVKYISSNAPSSRWDISFEYEIPESEHNDDDSHNGGSDEK